MWIARLSGRMNVILPREKCLRVDPLHAGLQSSFIRGLQYSAPTGSSAFCLWEDTRWIIGGLEEAVKAALLFPARDMRIIFLLQQSTELTG